MISNNIMFASLKGICPSIFNVQFEQDSLLEKYFYYIGQENNYEYLPLSRSYIYRMDFLNNGCNELLTYSCGIGDHFINGNGFCEPTSVSWFDLFD